MDTIMLKHGVCCGHIVTGTEVQQQNTTWVQTIPPNHTPSGNTVAAHVSVEVSLVGAPSSTSPTASKKAVYSALLYRPLRWNNSKTILLDQKAQKGDPLIHWEELQRVVAELGSKPTPAYCLSLQATPE